MFGNEMKTHKQMQAERRIKEAQALRIAKRERFVRKWLRRRGIMLQANNYDEECFRGSMAMVSGFYKCGGCIVGIIEGCTNCRSKMDPGSFRNSGDSICRGIRPKATKIWIVQEDEKLKKPIGKPGVYRIFRKKPVLDSHGHVVPEPNFANMPDFDITEDLPTIQPAPVIMEPQPSEWDAPPTLGTLGGPTIEIAEAPIPDDVHVPNPIDIMWLNAIISIVHPTQAAELQNAWNQGRLLCDDAHTRLYINTT